MASKSVGSCVGNMEGYKNIIVFGESGGGKSSVINLLTESSAAQTSDRAIGCTFHHQKYQYGDFTIYDTAGLSEGSMGRVSHSEAIRNLISLLKSLSDGVNLLIFVIRKDRIKETTEKNYNLFVNGICQGQVPVILVVTNCETENFMGSWWEDNKCYFSLYGMNFLDVISGTTADPDNHLGILRQPIVQRREETRRRLETSIGRCCLGKAWRMVGWTCWFKVVFRRICKILFDLEPYAIVPKLRDLFMSVCQMSQKEATELSNECASEACGTQ